MKSHHLPNLDLQEKVLCRVCFERDIAVVLIPCRHRILCRLVKLYTRKSCSLASCLSRCLLSCLSSVISTDVLLNVPVGFISISFKLIFISRMALTEVTPYIFVSSFCSEKCKHCPVCRNTILERMPVYDV